MKLTQDVGDSFGHTWLIIVEYVLCTENFLTSDFL